MTLIADRMKELGLTDLMVSKQLDVPTNTIYNWRKGLRRPRLENARTLSQVLQISISDLRESIGDFHEGSRKRTKTDGPSWMTRKRMESGFASKQLAERINLDYYLVKAIEMGQRKLPVSRVQLLADALEVSVADVLVNVEVIPDEQIRKRRTKAELAAAHAEPPPIREGDNRVRRPKVSANYYPNAERAGTCIEGDNCPRFRCKLCGAYFLLQIGHDCPSTKEPLVDD